MNPLPHWGSRQEQKRERSQIVDIAPTTRWRRLVPAWLRALIWVDAAARYDAFLSYSWKADSAVAPTLHGWPCRSQLMRGATFMETQ
jgi:hypothetical protein